MIEVSGASPYSLTQGKFPCKVKSLVDISKSTPEYTTHLVEKSKFKHLNIFEYTGNLLD